MNALPYVMVVDDDEELRQGVCELLEEDGFRTVSAESGASALSRLRTGPERPSVILLDLMMPVMNGWQFREAQLSDPELRSIPVVVMTASRDAQGIDANAVVFKPFNLDQLVNTVRHHANASTNGAFTEMDEAPTERRLAQGFVPQESEASVPDGAGSGAAVELFAQTPAPVAVLGEGFVFEMANERYRALWNRRDLVGQSLFDVIPELGGQGLEEALRRVVDTGEPFVAKETRFDGGGEERESFWNTTYARVLDSQGKVGRLIVFCADVTEQVIARREIQQREEKLHRIVTQVDAGIAQTDFEGRFTLVNERYREIVGRSEAELYQARLHDITHPDDLGTTVERFDAMLRDGSPFALEKRYVKPDGSIVWVQDSLSRLHDGVGCPIGASVVTVDITHRKFAEWALRQSEERFRQIFETAEVSLWEEDLSALERFVEELRGAHGPNLRRVLQENPDLVERAIGLVRTTDVNPSTLRTFEAASKAQLREGLHTVLLPETSSAVVELIAAIAEGARVFASQTVLRTLSGKRLDVVITAGLPGGRDWHRVLVTLVDISAQKQVEREREARVAEMERALHFSEMFVGMLGHDLRNPLGAITTWARLLQSRADSEKISKPAAGIVTSAERMDRMIVQLLDFTRIRLGRGVPLERVPLDLAEQCRTIVGELQSVYEREIRFDVVGDSTGIWDRDRLSQLLSNLVANACQHGTPQTPVAIQIDGSATDVVALEIHNQGAISPTLLPVVFEPLRRSGQRRERRAGSSGLGLGLYITQQVIVAHGGSIGVESGECEGTRFVVRLPRHPSNVDSGQSSQSPEGGDTAVTGVFDAGGAPSSPRRV